MVIPPSKRAFRKINVFNIILAPTLKPPILTANAVLEASRQQMGMGAEMRTWEGVWEGRDSPRSPPPPPAPAPQRGQAGTAGAGVPPSLCLCCCALSRAGRCDPSPLHLSVCECHTQTLQPFCSQQAVLGGIHPPPTNGQRLLVDPVALMIWFCVVAVHGAVGLVVPRKPSSSKPFTQWPFMGHRWVWFGRPPLSEPA